MIVYLAVLDNEDLEDGIQLHTTRGSAFNWLADKAKAVAAEDWDEELDGTLDPTDEDMVIDCLTYAGFYSCGIWEKEIK